MATFKYAQDAGSFKGDALMDELIDALGVVPYVESAPDGSVVIITVPDGISQQAVEAVLAAHDPTKPSNSDKAAIELEKAKAVLAATDVSQLEPTTAALVTLARGY